MRRWNVRKYNNDVCCSSSDETAWGRFLWYSYEKIASIYFLQLFCCIQNSNSFHFLNLFSLGSEARRGVQNGQGEYRMGRSMVQLRNNEVLNWAYKTKLITKWVVLRPALTCNSSVRILSFASCLLSNKCKQNFLHLTSLMQRRRLVFTGFSCYVLHDFSNGHHSYPNQHLPTFLSGPRWFTLSACVCMCALCVSFITQTLLTWL